MGTLAAGIKEIFATAKTTGSNVMLCGNDGTPDGHMTMANLASVLGAIKKEQAPASLNDLFGSTQPNTIVIFGTGVQNTPFDYGTCFTVNSTTTGYQIQLCMNASSGNHVAIRSSSEDNWYYLNYDIPDFYKNYADLASLANALGVLGYANMMPSNGDLTTLPHGIYCYNGILSTFQNFPQIKTNSNWVAVVIENKTWSTMQHMTLLFCIEAQQIWMAMNTEWSLIASV